MGLPGMASVETAMLREAVGASVAAAAKALVGRAVVVAVVATVAVATAAGTREARVATVQQVAEACQSSS